MDLRFACQPGCTSCCRQQGYVYLTGEDVKRAASFLEMNATAFEHRYVYRTTHLRRLRKPRDLQCPFLLENGCRIHPAKPTQCRAYPFWPELIETSGTWSAAGNCCPGIGQGPRTPYGQASEISHEMLTAYPSMYRNPKSRNGTR